MPTISATEDDKQRFLHMRQQMDASSQQETLRQVLDITDAAIALSSRLQCAPDEIADTVERLLQHNQALQEKITELKPPTYTDDIEREVADLVRQIMAHNDSAGTSEHRWMITLSILKKLSTRNQSVIKRVIEDKAMADSLASHHNRHQLHGMMANRGKDVEALKAALGL